MKLIENKETAIKLTEDTNVKYADLLISVINKPVREAVSLKDMRRDLKLMEAFENATESVELSDDDFNYIAEAVESSQWLVKHLDIVAFADYIDSLK